MMKVLAASAILAGCLALTCAQAAPPETIVATGASSRPFAPSMNTVALRPTVVQFTPRLTSSTVHSQTSVVPGLMQRQTWDTLSQIYSKWRHGFPRGTSLTSLLPDVDDPDDYLHNLYRRDANSDNATFWERMVAASNRGELTTDTQLLSVAFIYFVCRKTKGALAECPDPCGNSPCLSLSMPCTLYGIGLYSDEYECTCGEHYDWHPKLVKCVFCGPGEKWDDTFRQCMRRRARGTTMYSPVGTSGSSKLFGTCAKMSSAIFKWAKENTEYDMCIIYKSIYFIMWICVARLDMVL